MAHQGAIEEAAASEPRPTLAGRSGFPIGRLLLVLAVGGVIAYFAISGGSGPSYKASVSGGFPKTQYVGEAEDVDVTVTNNGTKRIPNLTIDLDNNDPWVVQSAFPDAKALGDGLYSFGAIAPGDSLDTTLTLVPKDAGNFTIDITVYGDVSDNSAQGLHSIGKGDPLDALSQDVAILP